MQAPLEKRGLPEQCVDNESTTGKSGAFPTNKQGLLQKKTLFKSALQEKTDLAGRDINV